MLTGSIRGLVACALVLALAEGVAGLYLAYWLDIPPGPPVAVLGALVCLATTAATRRQAA
jgi:ABC-type Mn2+/Zn2+ transport system permease subunit